MPSRRFHSAPLALAAAPSVVAALLLTPAALHAQPPVVITACYPKPLKSGAPGSGTVYRIDKPQGSAPGAPLVCAVGDIEFNWNQQGPIGLAGPQGPQGIVGPAGATGPLGPQGPKGDAGPPGATGPAGAVGPIGPQGLVGAPGADGKDGAQGLAGPAGAPGPQGMTGDTGPAGPQGVAGAPGAVGPKGDKGDTGLQGPQGTPGTNGVSNYEVVIVRGGNARNQSVSEHFAACPSGKRVVGGGINGRWGYWDHNNLTTLGSFPADNGTGWWVRIYNTQTNDYAFDMFAICVSAL